MNQNWKDRLMVIMVGLFVKKEKMFELEREFSRRDLKIR